MDYAINRFRLYFAYRVGTLIPLTNLFWLANFKIKKYEKGLILNIKYRKINIVNNIAIVKIFCQKLYQRLPYFCQASNNPN